MGLGAVLPKLRDFAERLEPVEEDCFWELFFEAKCDSEATLSPGCTRIEVVRKAFFVQKGWIFVVEEDCS